VLRSLTAISLMSLSATVLMGLVGATVMYLGARQILAGTLTLGGFMAFTAYLAFLVAPMFQVVGIGTQMTEALAGLDRTQEVLHETARGRGRAAHRGHRRDGATCRSST
jgi:ABC-type bacteriocin/lantibiotic exporter with double-glycine peptidase domain